MKSHLALGLCFTWIMLILIAPQLTSIDPRQTNPTNTQAPPQWQHLFGTDNLGRDVYSRTLHGGQRTLMVSFSALLIAVIPALMLAMLTILWKTYLHTPISAMLDAWLAFPSLLIALVILTIIGRGLFPISIAVGLAQLPYVLRVVLTALQQGQNQPYITSAHALGASKWHIIRYHLLPNAQPTIASYTSITFAYCIINTAGLSLLGLGGDPSIPEWGVMLATGRDTFRYAPWVALAPAIAISLTIILANRLADSFR
ncbi:MAG: ABC transporter permease [Chloroflexota bacterium]